jgi:hypothetical protein
MYAAPGQKTGDMRGGLSPWCDSPRILSMKVTPSPSLVSTEKEKIIFPTPSGSSVLPSDHQSKALSTLFECVRVVILSAHSRALTISNPSFAINARLSRCP